MKLLSKKATCFILATCFFIQSMIFATDFGGKTKNHKKYLVCYLYEKKKDKSLKNNPSLLKICWIYNQQRKPWEKVEEIKAAFYHHFNIKQTYLKEKIWFLTFSEEEEGLLRPLQKKDLAAKNGQTTLAILLEKEASQLVLRKNNSANHTIATSKRAAPHLSCCLYEHPKEKVTMSGRFPRDPIQIYKAQKQPWESVKEVKEAFYTYLDIADCMKKSVEIFIFSKQDLAFRALEKEDLAGKHNPLSLVILLKKQDDFLQSRKEKLASENKIKSEKEIWIEENSSKAIVTITLLLLSSLASYLLSIKEKPIPVEKKKAHLKKAERSFSPPTPLDRFNSKSPFFNLDSKFVMTFHYLPPSIFFCYVDPKPSYSSLHPLQEIFSDAFYGPGCTAP